MRCSAETCFSRSRKPSVPHRGQKKRQLCVTRWGGRSIRMASRLFALAAILQLLLGNIGRPGGGIMALRGHASIQGSTDIPTLYDILPGYLPMPRLGVNSHDLATYLSKHRDRTGWWWNIDKYIVSLLKAYYGEAATKDNDWRLRLAAASYWRPFASGLLPRHDGRQGGRAVSSWARTPPWPVLIQDWSARRSLSCNGWSYATW